MAALCCKCAKGSVAACMKPAEDQPETRGRWMLCSISKHLKGEGLSSLCPISWRGCELRVFPAGLVRKAEPLLVFLGLCSGKRPHALFYCTVTAQRLNVCGLQCPCKCMASFLNSASEEIDFPARF